MQPLVIEIEKYPEAMKGAIGKITKIDSRTGKRTRNNTSTDIIHITVKDKTNSQSLVLLLQEADLYIVGFISGGGNTYLFKDHAAAVTGASILPINGSYTTNPGLNVIFADKAERTLGSIQEAIRNLSAYSGGTVSFDEKIHFGIMCYLISESFRFRVIYNRMVEVVKRGQSFKFTDYENHVKNWSKISIGQCEEGTSQADLATYHTLL